MQHLTKLNLGCGEKRFPGFLNVDKYGTPDQKVDLEQFPWPWENDRFDEVHLIHVLEHLGATSDIFLGIMRELYRICAPNAVVKIAVPHPRHDHFINDPTHVRPITGELMQLFSVEQNRYWVSIGAANSTLALYNKVDFRVENNSFTLEEPWRKQYSDGTLPFEELNKAVRQHNNVVSQIDITLRVIKPWVGLSPA